MCIYVTEIDVCSPRKDSVNILSGSDSLSDQEENYIKASHGSRGLGIQGVKLESAKI